MLNALGGVEEIARKAIRRRALHEHVNQVSEAVQARPQSRTRVPAYSRAGGTIEKDIG